jgi:large subunit GTPase 1
MPEKSGGKAKKGANLGRSIMRQQFREQPAVAELETERGKGKLRSVTQCDDLEEFMTNATLEGTDFAARRGEVIVLASEARTVTAHGAPRDASVATDLPVPRRPIWKEGMGAEELDERERAAFVGWRRSLANLEEVDGECLTPFEKNLEVWRQLWRVLERSQLVVQIVDARNPLLFRSIDLERYASELVPPRPCMLLVNKADLLSPAQREEWAAYFQRKGIEAIFWSATAAQGEIDAWARGERPEEESSSGEEEMGDAEEAVGLGEGEAESDSEEEEQLSAAGGREGPSDAGVGAGAGGAASEEGSEDDEDAMLMRLAATAQRAPPHAATAAAAGESDPSTAQSGRVGVRSGAAPRPPLKISRSARVLRRGALLRLLLSRCPPGPDLPDGRPSRVVGLVGYPNVGKSSTVNAMVAAKKTNVSATPGKTKHFQTLHVPDCPELVLCDCPGLVFPSIAGSKAQMICDGILPVDQMREYMPPIRLLCGRLSQDDLFRVRGGGPSR